MPCTALRELLTGVFMRKTKILGIAMLALTQSAFGQTPPPPGAGGQIQQIPPAPVPQRAPPEIRIEPGTGPAPAGIDQNRIAVKSLHVTGQSQYPEAELVAVTGFVPGTELTLSDLQGMAARIADYYHRNGYIVAQAYLPPQDVKDGAVTIAVLEGRYGNVTLRNQARLSDSLPNGLLAGLNSGDPITIAPLENRLLLLSDIPGVNVRSTLNPGASPGTSDLIVDVTPGQSVSGEVDADNAGNRYTGEYRIGATVNFNNLTGHGDVASLRAMTSGTGLNYGRASYQTRVGKATVGVAYTALAYRLGEEFASLHAHGTAEIASVYGSYPLIRSRDTNLYAVIDFDAKKFQDKVDLTSTVTDKKAQVVMAGLNGNHRDNIGGGGLSSYGATLSTGNIDIETAAARTADAATAQTNGHFGKLQFNASRLQSLTERISLYGAINGQIASKNLDISEKMELGGMYAVRAYPEGEAFADEGYVATVEARLLLPKFSERVPGQVHLIGFVDTGSVTINKNPWAPGQNHRTLSGAGIGLTWSDYNNFVVNVYYAHKLGNAAAISAPDKAGRFWIQAIKYF
ncbi:MAG TPA: ShlB/FhaC/HecB family hemolysin secretion/activation protein [Burkholderiales bacterium]|nr:ShlB/FhaC/HecB family hemolysin secretion/activation protein [Burkholderiales bacterium]